MLLLAAAAFCFVGLVGNKALASSKQASFQQRWRKAESEARRAVRWTPWASAALQQLAETQFALGDRKGSYASLLKATRKGPGKLEPLVRPSRLPSTGR